LFKPSKISAKYQNLAEKNKKNTYAKASMKLFLPLGEPQLSLYTGPN